MKHTESDTPPEHLLEWLRGLETVGCTRIEAKHLVAGQEGASVVATFEIAEREDGGDRFDGPNVYRRLVDDAESIGGVQRYTLLAFRDGSKTPRERKTLRVDGGTGDSDASATEPANAAGLVAQAHRHNEAIMNMLARTFGTTIATLQKQNEMLGNALTKANDERTEVWQLLSEISKGERERDALKHQRQLDEKRADVMRDGIKLLMPALVGKLSGAMGVPAANVVQEEGLARFIESLTPQQQASMFSLLTPEQATALGGVLDTIVKKKEEAQGGSDH